MLVGATGLSCTVAVADLSVGLGEAGSVGEAQAATNSDTTRAGSNTRFNMSLHIIIKMDNVHIE